MYHQNPVEEPVRLQLKPHLILKRHHRGQSTVEFILMMFVFTVVMAAFMSTTFFAAQGLLTRYVAYMGARGYMAYSNTPYGDKWKEGVRTIERIVPNRLGPAIASQSGDGVVVNIRVRELFPALRIIGETGTAEVNPKASLGTEPRLSGDNTL